MLTRFGFIAGITIFSIICNSPKIRIMLGSVIFVCSLLIIILTYKKPKCNFAKARIHSIKEFEHESQYKLRFSPKDCSRFPKDYDGEAFYAETPRYENSFKKGKVGDVVDAGWYEYTNKADGTNQIKSVITEKGYYIYARKFVKFYFIALVAGCGVCAWGILSFIIK